MMSEKEIQSWVSDEMVKLWWTFADDLEDEGQERMKEELEYLEPIMVKIIKKHITA